MKMKIKEIAIGLAFFAGVVELYASNLVYNSSFELEGAGWNSHTWARVLDDKRAVSGECFFPRGGCDNRTTCFAHRLQAGYNGNGRFECRDADKEKYLVYSLFFPEAGRTGKGQFFS